MAEGGPQDDLDAELERLVLDDAFVDGAKIIELRPTTQRTAPSRPSTPSAPAPPTPFWTPHRRQLAFKAAIGVLVALIFAAVMAALKDRGVGQAEAPVAGSHVEAGMYGPGDCLVWPDSEAAFATRAGIEAVPSAQPHRIEIVGSVRLDRETAYPSGFRMNQLVDVHCPALLRGRLGHDLEPGGRFTIGALHPTMDSWRFGDRALWCGVVLRTPSPGGDYAKFEGAVA